MLSENAELTDSATKKLTLKKVIKMLKWILIIIIILFMIGAFVSKKLQDVIAILITILIFIAIGIIIFYLCFKLISFLLLFLGKYRKKQGKQENIKQKLLIRQQEIERQKNKEKERLIQQQLLAKQQEEERIKIEEKKRQQLLEKQQKIQAKYDESNKIINDIPKYDIEIKSGNRINRKRITDLPEIKLSTINKATNIQNILNNYVAIDVETTGLVASRERIIQLSAIRFENGIPVEKFDTFINPKRHIPEEATEINNITDDMVASSPIIGEVADSFLKFLGNSAIIGYNIPFDLKFLYLEGIDLLSKRRKIYDIYELVQKSHIDTYNNKLETVSNYIGVYADAHNSLADCYLTNAVFMDMIENAQRYRDEYEENKYYEI